MRRYGVTVRASAKSFPRHCEPHSIGRGNPAFLLDVLLDCFFGWLYLDCFAALAMTKTGTEASATKRVFLKDVNFWQPL